MLLRLHPSVFYVSEIWTKLSHKFYKDIWSVSILLLLACCFPHISFLPQIRVFTSRGWCETIKTNPMAMEWEEVCWSLVLSLKQDTKTPSGTFRRRRCQRRWNWQVWDLGWYVNSESMQVMAIGKAGIDFIFKSMEKYKLVR